MELIRSGHGEEKRAAAYLVWEDLTVSVMATNLRNGSSTRKLLCGLTGYAQPHRLMAIMGPSGSGKSTLLDSFAGRLSSNVVMTGTVVLSCRKSNLHSRDILIHAYAAQDDVFLGTLTVQETLSYSAHLRLPATMTKDDVDYIVENTITKMGLQDCANKKIGNWHFRGISGGEKKRLSIGLQILTQPTILLLDEPTSGLDSASAFFVMEALRGIARDGRVVLCSTHQPSSDVFQLFDDLLLLSDGETVYFGETKNAIQFFADAGFPCPTRRNPPDHFLICINSDFDKVIATLMQTGRHIGFAVSSESPSNLTTTEIRERLVQKYKCSEYSTNARKKIQEISLIGEQFRESNISYPSWWKQLWILTRRSSLNMSRDIGYYWLRLVFYILVSISAGTLFFDIGTSKAAVISRGKCDAFFYGLMICWSIAGLPFFIEEVKVFLREKSGGHYGEAVYVLSNFLSSFPFVVAISISSGTVVNYMVKFHSGFSHYCYFIMNLFCCIAAAEAFVLIIATLVPSLLMGIGASAGALVFMMMPSSLFCQLSDLPKVFWYYPMSYVSFAAWAIEGQYKNDMIGLEFEPPIPGQPKLKGEMLLQFTFGINPNHSKWRDLAAVMCSLICFKLLFYMMLKYKDRASSIFHRLFAKRSILDSHRNPSRKE